MAKCSDCPSEALKGRKVCGKCKWRRYVNADPIRASYVTLRSNSKRRKKYFDLTLEEFTEFCHETTYHIGKGRTKKGLSIDCKDNDRGYTKDNIRVLPLGENSSKSTLCYDEYERRLLFRKKIEVEQGDCPF